MRSKSRKEFQRAVEDVGADELLTPQHIREVATGKLLGDGQYAIERLLAERTRRGRSYFVVRWAQWCSDAPDARDDTEEPEARIPAAMVAAFRKEQATAAAAREADLLYGPLSSSGW